MHSSIDLVPTVCTLLHVWSLAWWACIWVCDPQTGSSLGTFHSKMLSCGDDLYFSITVSSWLAFCSHRNPFSFLFRFLCLVECLCLGFYFIKRLPDCISVSPGPPGSVGGHRSRGWRRPSGWPLSLPGLHRSSRACSFLLGICNIFQSGSWLWVSWACSLFWLEVGVSGTMPNIKLYGLDSPRWQMTAIVMVSFVSPLYPTGRWWGKLVL